MSHPCAFFLAQGRESTAVGRVGFPPFPQKETERMGHGDATAILRPMRIERFGGPGVIGVATVLALFFALARIAANAQAHAANNAVWQMQNSGTTAGLRGIDSVDGTVAWASGTGGTVLRTTDGGAHWTKCAVPDADKDGATLDFRGVQAWDATTAIVMASGPGDKSRLYKTADGCGTWKLIFTNPDKDGFWDALLLNRYDKDGELLGDPVGGKFAFWETDDKGTTWQRERLRGLDALPNEGAFAASNSALFDDERFATGFVTGGVSGARIFVSEDTSDGGGFATGPLPLRGGSAGSGGFSIDDRDWCCRVAVGGDYRNPNDAHGSAAYTLDGGKLWSPSTTLPHGYRSSVQWSESLKLWITVGTNGSDISRDDGKNWKPLDDGNWNALSLPFVVGPNGRIAKLNPSALPVQK